jgi:predicted deacetylase
VNKKRRSKVGKYIKVFILSFILILIVLILSVFLIRLFSARHLDDLNPNIPCDEELIKKSDYLSVIPLYSNENISENKDWCEYIKHFDKKLIMHGVYHTYNEFNTSRYFNYTLEGKEIFFDCFGFNPTEFKAPQLALSEENKKRLEEDFGFKIHTKFTQLFHKVYPCNDSGIISNKIQDLI